MTLDLEAFEKAVRAKQRSLESMPVASWKSYSSGRASGLSLAVSMLREHIVEEDV